MLAQLEWSEALLSSGVQLEQESLVGLGVKPEWTLTVKIRCPSFGADTELRDMLLSMSFEEESRSVMYFGGSIDILSTWKLKDQVFHCLPKKFGSLQTCILDNGIQS